MHSIFNSKRSKGGVLTNVLGHFKKNNAFANNQEISQEELIRLNEITLEKRAKLKTKSKAD